MSQYYSVDKADTVALETLLRHVLPTVGNIPHELGVDLLRQSYIRFATKAQLLATSQDIVFQKDVADYELVAPEGYELYMVREAGIRDKRISAPVVDYWYISYGVSFAIVGNKNIIFKEATLGSEDDIFNIVSTVIPNEFASRIPREVSVPFGEIIAYGAIARALMFKTKPWYDPGLAAKFERDFNRGVLDAMNLNINNRGARPMEARTRRWI